MRALLLLLAVHCLKAIAKLFYTPYYLQGKHFEKSRQGYVWILNGIWFQKILGFNRHIPWPISPTIKVSNPKNLSFHPDDLNNFQTFGCYYQNFSGKITLGRGTYVSPNVGIITANHDPLNLNSHLSSFDVVIGSGCWIGMNSVILPGVHLGDHTVVGAGSIVTKSFLEGNCVIAGNPAKIIKILPKKGGES